MFGIFKKKTIIEKLEKKLSWLENDCVQDSNTINAIAGCGMTFELKLSVKEFM